VTRYKKGEDMAREKGRTLADTTKDRVAKFAGEDKETVPNDRQKVTLYITKEQMFALEDIRRKRIRAGARLSEVDKSSLMREAVDLLMKKEGV
jgi:hypothetical protein